MLTPRKNPLYQKNSPQRLYLMLLVFERGQPSLLLHAWVWFCENLHCDKSLHETDKEEEECQKTPSKIM